MLAARSMIRQVLVTLHLSACMGFFLEVLRQLISRPLPSVDASLQVIIIMFQVALMYHPPSCVGVSSVNVTARASPDLTE